VTLKTDERIESLRQQILSRTQLEQIIKEFDLYPRERVALPLQDVVDKMRSAIDVVMDTKGREVDSFHVRFTYTDATVAASVTTRLGGLFADFNSRDRSTLAEATDAFLQTQLAEARGRLEAQEQKLEAFRRRNAGRLPTQLSFNMQAIQNAQLQLQALVESIARDRDRKLILEQLLADAQVEPAAPPPPATGAAASADAAAVSAAATPAQQLRIARERLALLEGRLTAEHPDVKAMKRLVADLQAKVDAEATAQPADAARTPPVPLTPAEQARRERVNNMKAEVESLDRQIAFKEAEEQKLHAKIADLQQRIEAIPGIESEWLTLTRDYDTLQQTYRDMLMKSESARVAADLENRQIGEQFRVLDRARGPVTPIGPNRLRINGIGSAVGLLLGLGLAALLEMRDRTFKTSADVIDVLALPVLAVVPVVETLSDRRRRRVRRLLVSTAVLLAGAACAYVVWTLQLWKHLV